MEICHGGGKVLQISPFSSETVENYAIFDRKSRLSGKRFETGAWLLCHPSACIDTAADRRFMSLIIIGFGER